MTLLAGFDFLTEVSNETLRKLVMNNLQIGGTPVRPPFELTLPISAPGASATAHLVCTDVQLDLNEGDTITLNLSFDRASVVATAPLALTVCPLAGSIAITAPIQLIDVAGSNKQVSVNMGAAAVAINWSAASSTEIANDLAGTPINAALFNSMATQALTNYVRTIPAPTIPLAFHVVPGVNGSFAPSLQFEKLEVHCIPNANRSRQALGLFGILLSANHSQGNHALKTQTSITAANNGVCISISPQAFHSLVFCPAIASSLSTDVGHLPASCGPASSFSTQGVNVNNIADSFANGHIDINGAVSKSGTCYDANGTFHGALTLSVSGSTITPNVSMDEPNIDVSIPWYCWLAAAVVLGPIGIALAGVADVVGDSIASSMAGDALRNALGSGLPGISMGSLSGATFSSVTITTEGLTLQGTVPIYVAPSYNTPSIDLTGSVITVSQEQISAGTFHTRTWCNAEFHDYPYVEYSQAQRGNYHLSGSMCSQPLTPHFSIWAAGGAPVALVGSSGSVALPAVNTHYPMPLATGGTAVVQTVHVSYAISGPNVQLANIPSEGCYGLMLGVTATDCAGNVLEGSNHAPMRAEISVQFEGDHAAIGGGYAEAVQECANQLSDFIRRMADRLTRQPVIPTFPPVNYPGPESMIQYIRDLVAIGPQADEILVSSKIAHGNSFYRGIFNQAARQPALLRAHNNSGFNVNSQQITSVAQTLADLSQQLMNAGAPQLAQQAQVQLAQETQLKTVDEATKSQSRTRRK